jgi:hypothetical protein
MTQTIQCTSPRCSQAFSPSAEQAQFIAESAAKGMTFIMLECHACDAFHAEVESKGDCHVSNASLLTRNKNTSYRNRILASSHAVAAVLQEAGLTTVDLLDRYQQAPSLFYLVDVDLTARGNAFVCARLRKWYAKTDRWKEEVPSFEKFKASFAKEYESFSAHTGTHA